MRLVADLADVIGLIIGLVTLYRGVRALDRIREAIVAVLIDHEDRITGLEEGEPWESSSRQRKRPPPPPHGLRSSHGGGR